MKKFAVVDNREGNQMVEVVSACRSVEISEALLDTLKTGWDRVFGVLKEIGVGVIADLDRLEVTLLEDREMGREHGRFLNDPTPTDVMTFDYGELLIGVEVAERQAVDYGTSRDREIALYGIHGMLHLAGFDDRDQKERSAMSSRQNELFELVFGPLFEERGFF